MADLREAAGFVLDQRGRFASRGLARLDRYATIELGAYDQAEHALGVWRALGIERAHLVAHDYGTSVATELIARRERGLLPIELASLTLCNGSMHIELARLKLTQKLLKHRTFGPLLARLTSKRLFIGQLRSILADPMSVAQDELELLAGTEHDQELFLAGETTPMLFGSAITNFGVRLLLDNVMLPAAVGYNPAGSPVGGSEADPAQVAFDKIATLNLAEPEPAFPLPPAPSAWQRIELEEVSFHYQGEGGFAVGPINLTIERGEQIFIIGGNGSGKSTLAMLLTGLYQPVSGRILLDGEPIADRNAYLALFSAIFTDYHLFQHLLGPEPKEALVAEWLERLQMGSKLAIEEGFIANIDLSQGQRKRVALLLALAEQREVMLFDEWAADQDPQFRRIFYQVLLPRLKEMGKTVIAISHDDLYFSLADRLLEMRQGQLIELTGERREQVSRDAVAHLDSEVPV